MAVINEIIVTGRKERRLINKESKLWQLISRWTKACDVEFDDGKTAQEKVGNINGITSDANLVNNDIASSIKPVHDVTIKTDKIKDNLDKGIINEHIQLVIDEDGNLGWKKDGADTVIPFSKGYNFTDSIILTVPEAGTGSESLLALEYSQITFPIDKIKKVSFTISKGWYGRFTIKLRKKGEPTYSEYFIQPVASSITNRSFNIDTRQYDRIMFYIQAHGGAGSAVIISNFITS